MRDSKMTYMNKIKALCLMLIAFALASCGDEGLVEDAAAETPILTRQLSRAQFIEDFDFFVDFFESYFPYHGLVYRRFGVDFMDIAAELRPTLEDENFKLDEDIFLELLRSNFSSILPWAVTMFLIGTFILAAALFVMFLVFHCQIMWK